MPATTKTRKTKVTSRNKANITSLLISQPEPETGKSSYYDLGKKYGMQVDFRQFIQVEGISSKEFRKARISPYDYSAVIFTSRLAIDHFFRVCEEMRLKMSMETKYFCISETVALYLQKYIQYRKRKVFFGEGRLASLMALLPKHKSEKILLPCAEVHKSDLPDFLDEKGFTYDKAMIYRTVNSDLSDLKKITYDMIAFFSPSGVKSLLHNFPKFKQGKVKIAAFGKTTCKAVEDAKLRLDIKAPTPETPSMGMAIEHFLKKG